MRIAMVCLGNICRSPMAAAVGQAMVDEAGLAGVMVESFGTAGYHVGQPADPGADAALRRRGWPAGGHRARRLEDTDVANADLVLCADRANLADVRRLARTGGDRAGTGTGDDSAKLRLLRSFDAEADPATAEVPDPWGGGDADFDTALELIERACRGLVQSLVAAPR